MTAAGAGSRPLAVVRSRPIAVVRSVVEEVRAEHVPFLAGSIAYSAFVALLPTLLLALMAASAVNSALLARTIIDLTEAYLSPTGQRLLVRSVTRAVQQAEFSVLGTVVLLWAVLRLFRGLDTAFAMLYDVEVDRGVGHQVRDGIVVLTAIGVAVVASVGTGLLIGLLPALPYVAVFDQVLLFLTLVAVFLPVYYVFPDAPVRIDEAAPGAAFAALGWTGLQSGFQWYVSAAATTELYGVIGGAILLITWLYVAALVVLVGATLNVVLAAHAGDDTADVTPA